MHPHTHKIIARLINENCKNLTDIEIERCLIDTVGAIKLIPLTKKLIIDGEITLNQINRNK